MASAVYNSTRVIGNVASGNGGDGIGLREVSTLYYPGFFVADNVADRNGGLGINAPAEYGYLVTDGGGNSAKLNGDPRQCVNIYCATNRGSGTRPRDAHSVEPFCGPPLIVGEQHGT